MEPKEPKPSQNSQEDSQETKKIELEQKLIEKIRVYFEDCQYIKYGGDRFIRLNLPLKEQEDKLICSELLDLIGILAWDDEEGLQIEDKRDISKLRLLGILDEEQFGSIDREISDYNPYAFPLNYSIPEESAEFFSREKQYVGKDSGELKEMDSEIHEITDRFYRGKAEEEIPENPKQNDNNFLRNLAGRYKWDKGKLLETKSGREITQAEQADLRLKAKHGDGEAMDTLLRIHIPLVYFVLDNFKKFFPVDDPDNLLQAGLIGLSRAIERNDPEKGKLSTYAVILIEAQMRRAWQESGPIHIPAHVFQDRNSYHLINEKSLPPEEKKRLLDNLARTLNFSSKKEMEEEFIIGPGKFVEVSDDTLKNRAPQEFSLAEEKSPEERTNRLALEKEIDNALETLTPRQARILRMRFFNDMTLEEIGNSFGVTRERIREIEAVALRRLRHPSRSEILRNFLNEIPTDEEEFPENIWVEGKGSTKSITTKEARERVASIAYRSNKRYIQQKDIAVAADELGIDHDLFFSIYEKDLKALRKAIFDNYRRKHSS